MQWFKLTMLLVCQGELRLHRNTRRPQQKFGHLLRLIDALGLECDSARTLSLLEKLVVVLVLDSKGLLFIQATCIKP